MVELEKDTFVQFCGEYTSIMNISSVDKVKEAAKVLAGWNGEKKMKSLENFYQI